MQIILGNVLISMLLHVKKIEAHLGYYHLKNYCDGLFK